MCMGKYPIQILPLLNKGLITFGASGAHPSRSHPYVPIAPAMGQGTGRFAHTTGSPAGRSWVPTPKPSPSGLDSPGCPSPARGEQSGTHRCSARSESAAFKIREHKHQCLWSHLRLQAL